MTENNQSKTTFPGESSFNEILNILSQIVTEERAMHFCYHILKNAPDTLLLLEHVSLAGHKTTGGSSEIQEKDKLMALSYILNNFRTIKIALEHHPEYMEKNLIQSNFKAEDIPQVKQLFLKFHDNFDLMIDECFLKLFIQLKKLINRVT